MAQQIELVVSPREVTGKATKHLRRAGIIPANISGHQQESQAIQLESMAFDRVRRAHGIRNVFTLRMSTGTQIVLLRQIQQDARTGRILHIDFSRVALNERVTTKVPLHFVGEAPAVKLYGGVLLHLTETLEVECTASNMIEALEVDITSLTEIDSALQAKDVKLPENYTLLIDPEELIIKVTSSRAIVEGAEAATAEASTGKAKADASV